MPDEERVVELCESEERVVVAMAEVLAQRKDRQEHPSRDYCPRRGTQRPGGAHDVD